MHKNQEKRERVSKPVLAVIKSFFDILARGTETGLVDSHTDVVCYRKTTKHGLQIK